MITAAMFDRLERTADVMARAGHTKAPVPIAELKHLLQVARRLARVEIRPEGNP